MTKKVFKVKCEFYFCQKDCDRLLKKQSYFSIKLFQDFFENQIGITKEELKVISFSKIKDKKDA